MRYFLFNLWFVGAKGSVRAPQGAHDQYEDEQLTTIQKRICLIRL